MLRSVLALSFCATAKAQEPPAVETAQVQTPVKQVVTPVNQTPSNTSPYSDGTWHFESLSYLWFPGIHGTVGARGYNASAHISASDILKNINIGIMGSFQAQHNHWAIPLDFVWAKLSDSKALINLPGYSVKATVKEGILTPKVAYLIVDGKAQVWGTAGLRYWHLGQNLKFTPNTNGISFGRSQNWVDVVGGARIVVPLSPKIAVAVLGDAGGGGANVDYQVAGMANYQIKPKWGLGVGYRYVDVNYRNSNKFIFDTAQSGIAFSLLYKYGKPANQ